MGQQYDSVRIMGTYGEDSVGPRVRLNNLRRREITAMTVVLTRTPVDLDEVAVASTRDR